MNKYLFNLIEAVLEKSESKIFQDAVKEWYIINYEEYECSCVCGKENIIQVYTIENGITGHTLSPIGSKCIEKFKNVAMNERKRILANKNKIFKNTGKKCDGLTYNEICRKHKSYIEFLKSLGKIKSKYEKLIEYYDVVNELI